MQSVNLYACGYVGVSLAADFGGCENRKKERDGLGAVWVQPSRRRMSGWVDGWTEWCFEVSREVVRGSVKPAEVSQRCAAMVSQRGSHQQPPIGWPFLLRQSLLRAAPCKKVESDLQHRCSL